MTLDETTDAQRRTHRPGRVLRGADDLADIALSCELTAEHPDEFAGTVWSIAYDQASIARFRSTPIVSRRTLEQLDDSFSRFVQFGFVRSGSIAYSQRNVEGVLRPGDGSLLLLDEPFVCKTLEDTEIVQIYLPSDLLDLHELPTSHLAGYHWKSSPLIDAIISFLLRLTAPAPGTENIGGEGIERTLFNLVTALMAEVTNQPMTDQRPRALALRRALDHIDRHAADPDLSASSIAAELGISRRYLYTLFEGRDMTLARLIQSRRVATAKRLLLDEAQTLTIPEIAHQAGFKGGDQLTRAFKAANNLAPVTYRSMMRDVKRHGHW